MPKKILIADDAKEIVLLIASRLKANNFEVIVANDALQAFAKALREKPDLILLDIKMPAGGGIGVLENLRASAETAIIPVIIITAFPSEEILQKVKELGVSGFIAKPFKADDLLRKIRKALGEVSKEEGS